MLVVVSAIDAEKFSLLCDYRNRQYNVCYLSYLESNLHDYLHDYLPFLRFVIRPSALLRRANFANVNLKSLKSVPKIIKMKCSLATAYA
jgi:hypothetical protein